jgi:hypothetical protein
VSIAGAAASLPILVAFILVAEPRPDARGSDARDPTATTPDLARWQGAWVLRDADYPGSIQAWNVQGDHVLVHDAWHASTEDERLAVVSPCRVARTLVLPDGTQQTTFDTFAFTSDGLHVALAPAGGGIRQGTLVTACIDDDVYELDTAHGMCRRYGSSLQGPVRTSRAECSIETTDVASSFVLRPLEGGSSVSLSVIGDVLLSRELMAHLAEPQPSFDAAIARADALR